jgi:hypothetical protein
MRQPRLIENPNFVISQEILHFQSDKSEHREEMTSAYEHLQWVAPAAPRAKQVPQSVWESRKVELCELYGKMKLEDVMVEMKSKYGFTAS